MIKRTETSNWRPVRKRAAIASAAVAIAIGSLYIASAVVNLVIHLLIGIGLSFKSINMNILQTVLAAIVYVLIISALLIGTKRLRRRTSVAWLKELLGLTRLPEWKDFMFWAGGFVLYMGGILLLTYLASLIFPGYDATQTQDTGFSHTLNQGEGIIVFLALVVIAPLAEEIIFRGWLFGMVRRQLPLWASVILVSLAFAFVHGQLNVGVDVFALSIALCLVREFSGSLWPSVMIHMTKNAVAFFALYVASGNLL